MNQPRFTNGLFAITDAAGDVVGREHFRLMRGVDGGIGLSSQVDLFAAGITRNVLYELDPAGLPRLASVGLAKVGRYSSASFGFGSREVRCVMDCDEQGHIEQRLTLDEDLRAFGTHALVNDAWFTRLYDDSGQAEQTFRLPVSSLAPLGDTGLQAVMASVTLSVREGGMIATPLGEVESRRFAVGFGPIAPIEVTVRADDRLLLAMDWRDENMMVRLEGLSVA